MTEDGGMTPHGDHLLHWPQADGGALELRLTPERAVHWPAERTMFVADMHLGKAAVFRARGVPVPSGTTTATLQRLSRVIERLDVQKLVVLGDFLHARESHAAPTLAVLRQWRLVHAQLECVVVQGNHDRHAGSVEDALGFATQHRPYQRPGLIGVHEAREALPCKEKTGQALVLAGHVHPVVRLRGRLDRLRLPCFWLQSTLLPHPVLTLPSFGEFTGGHEVHPQGSHVFVIGEKVRPLP